jgi:lysozyme
MTKAISASGLALIQELEGFHAEPKQLPTGGWVVGHSHVRLAEPGDAVNENDARNLLALDLGPFESLVNALVTQPLTQSQFDALVSFAFSVGSEAFGKSQVLRRINAGDYVSAACAMDAWRKSDVGGELVIVDTLVRRRTAEKALFLRELPQIATPSAFVRPQLDHAASVLGAPVTYTPAPEVGSIAPAPPKPEPAQRLGEILQSEPATEALLLTQVANDAGPDDCEIATAHAKPVARFDFEPRVAPRRSAPSKAKAWFRRTPPAPKGADVRLHRLRKRAQPGIAGVLMAAFGVKRAPPEEGLGAEA